MGALSHSYVGSTSVLPDNYFSRQEEEPGHVESGKRTLYIVFESDLLSLFFYCLFCGSSTKISKKVIGSFLKIIQMCHHCEKKHHWESQPHVGTIPAGNILMSSAILFAKCRICVELNNSGWI